MKTTEVRIAGFGGQGVVLAGILLGTAAVLFDGKKAVQTQSYGAETRGGGARSEVILSDTESPVYPRVTKPDVMVAMSETAIQKFLKDLKPGGTLIIDTDLVKEVPRQDCTIYKVPATTIAVKELGRQIVANIVMVGALVGLTNLVTVQAMEKSIEKTVPKGTTELNLKAFRKGLQIAEKIKRGEA